MAEPAVDRQRRVERLQAIAKARQSRARSDARRRPSVVCDRDAKSHRLPLEQTDAWLDDACLTTFVSASETTK